MVMQRSYIETFGSVDAVQDAPLSMLFAEDGFWLNPRVVEPDSP